LEHYSHIVQFYIFGAQACMMKGKLYLIPALIGDTTVEKVIPAYIKDTINGIRHYIVENERTARRTLLKLGIQVPINEIKFYILNEHTDQGDIPNFLNIAEQEDIGLLSEAGVPAVADPGSEVVALAHLRSITVIPLVGPSSILLSMMASGLNGQNFAFNGYIPVKGPERTRKLKQLESRSGSEHQSQIFIEAPYRNNQLLKDIISICNENTLLCIASEITTENEFIQTHSLRYWKSNLPELHKKTVIFILQA
jgi:16S rRNA (cytidine1402-2'-O)-methyltransferase